MKSKHYVNLFSSYLLALFITTAIILNLFGVKYHNYQHIKEHKNIANSLITNISKYNKNSLINEKELSNWFKLSPLQAILIEIKDKEKIIFLSKNNKSKADYQKK